MKLRTRLSNRAHTRPHRACCPQPVSLDIPVIKTVLDEVAAAGIKFQVGFNRRFDSNFRRVQRAVADGEVGVLHQVRITSRDPAPPPIEYVKVRGWPCTRVRACVCVHCRRVWCGRAAGTQRPCSASPPLPTPVVRGSRHPAA